MKTLFPLAAALVLLANNSYAQNTGNKISSNEFNPAISLILDARYTDIDQEDLELHGFQLGGEAGLPDKGFSTGHNELVVSANVDDKLYASMTTALVLEDGEVAVELEEAFIESLSNWAGFTGKAGRFYSGFGYINVQHDHAQDFTDRPWVYDALLGGHLIHTGVQVAWQAPTDVFLQLGAEISAGSEYPGGENESNNNGSAFFIKTGSDIGDSSSWQLGASYFQSEFDVREAGGHHHGEADADAADNELKDGKVDVAGVDFVYKWAPNGNNKDTEFTFKTEYLVRNESGMAEFTEGTNTAEANYDGKQSGFYAQVVYKFLPQWRVGVRYGQLKADNRVSDIQLSGIAEDEFLEESSLGSNDDKPSRSSIMLDWSNSHFSVFRLQYNRMDFGEEKDNSISLQYLVSLGSHGAHGF